jgi:hypothetical protein
VGGKEGDCNALGDQDERPLILYLVDEFLAVSTKSF